MHIALAVALGLAWVAGPEPADATARVEPPVVVAPRVEPAAMPSPDPVLVARNQQLSARSRRGDRFLITGRLVGSTAGLLLCGGVAMLVVHYVTERDDSALLIGGAVLTATGGAALGVSGGLSFHGTREIEAARRGELPAPPRARVALRQGLRIHF